MSGYAQQTSCPFDMLTLCASHSTSPTMKRQESAASLASLQRQPVVVTPASMMKPTSVPPPPAAPMRMDQQPVDPAMARRDVTMEPGYADAIKAWTRFRFVRAGWFTATEAIEYIN